jgi:uncharacterized membrane protein YfcA
VIHLDAVHAALVAGAAFLAAGVNAVAGGGTLLSFPALLLLGMPPLAANVTNTVGLVTGYAGGSAAYRVQLRDQRRRVVVLGGVSVAGAFGGAVLLVHTSPQTFAAAVPWILIAASLIMAAQPWLSRAVDRRRERGAELSQPALHAATFVAAVYGAFFGAGFGVLTLAVVGMFLRDTLQRLNALKGVVSLVVNVVAACAFAVIAKVDWLVAAIMLPSALAGGAAGVAVARRLPPAPLRIAMIAIGLAAGIRLLV